MLLPSGKVATELDRLTDEVSLLIGPKHWKSGAADRAHFTVRALEYHDDSNPESAAVDRYVAALERAAANIEPITLVIHGLIASPASVMAVAASPDGTADELRRRFGEELGEDSWLEDKHFKAGRDSIWYVSLLHFASEVERPEDLLRWLDAREEIDIGTVVIDKVSVCRWAIDDQGMRPERLADVLLS